MAAGVKHLVLVKFRDGVVVDELVRGMTELVAAMDTVKSFEWGSGGIGAEGAEMLAQGFTHVFVLTFASADDFSSYSGHPSHLEFAGTFAAALEKALVFDYPAVAVKA